MADSDKFLEDLEYRLWVQAGTCLGFAKKGLESFATQQSQVLHQRIRFNVRSKFQQQSSISSMCPYISVVNKQNRWRMNCFPSCQNCQLYLDELDTLRVSGFRFEKGNWSNANIDIWPTSAWDMAKVFMNPGQDRNCQKAKETDLSGILNFIDHCTVPNMAIANTQNIKKVRDSRNAVMHSSTFKVKPQEFQDCTNAMIDLLEDQTRLFYDQDAKDAVMQIKEAKSANFTITTDAELRVLRDKALELRKENKTLQENVKYMQDQCDDLEGKDDEQSQTPLAQLVKDIDEREKNLQELRSTFSKVEHLASRKQYLKAKMEEHTVLIAAALHATIGMLAYVKKSCRASTKERQDFIDQATEECTSVEEKYDALRAIDLNTENENTKAENLALSKSNIENENTMKQKQLEIDEMERAPPDCKNDFKSAAERADQLQEKLDIANEERGKLASENQKLQAEFCKLVDKWSEDAAINVLRETMEQMQQEIDERKQALQDCKNDFKSAAERAGQLQEKLDIANEERDKQYLGRLTKSIPGDEPKQESIFKQGMMSYLNKSISEDKVYKQGLPRTLFAISALMLHRDTISKIIQFHGLRSTYGDRLTSWLCASIRAFSSRVIRVMVGYEMGHGEIPLFVAVVSEIDKSLPAHFQTICQFQVKQRLLTDVSEEAKLCVKEEIDKSLTLLEHNELQEAIVKESEELLKSHSNLLMISASALKSSKAGNQIEIKTCIVLYVHIKGIIPLKEKPFPLNIGKFPVDVREGLVYMYSDKKLTIGCNIASEYMRGRLGGFVRLSNGKIGCITCSHLFGTPQSRPDEFNGNVYFRSKDDQLYPFGHLMDEVFRPGGKTVIGVDAALIEITDRLMCPDDGGFETTEIPLAADFGQPSGFHSGEILTSPQEIAELQTNKNAKCIIVRYDDTNKRMFICTGVLKVSGTTLDAYYPANLDEKCRLYAQMEINPCPPAKEFANFGDSGSLVFLVNEHTDDIWAIGMVVGGVSSGAAIVTPIWAILESLNLPKNLLSFENKRIKKIEHGMKNIQRQMENIHHQTHALAGIHNQTQQDLAGMRHQIQQDMDDKLNPIQQALAEILSRLPPR